MKKALLALLMLLAAAIPGFSAPAFQNEISAYVIANAEDLKWFRQAVNGGMTELNAVLSGDIDLGAQSWGPIGDSEDTAYNGSFDGDGYRIRGLSIRGGGQFLGLFGCVGHSGVVADLRVENASIVFEGSIGASIGVIAGISRGIIEDCEVIKCEVRAAGAVDVPLPIHAGAVAGSNSDGVIIRCISLQNHINISDAAISEREVAAGGICGMNVGLTRGVGLIMGCESLANEVVISAARAGLGSHGGGIAGFMLGGIIRESSVHGGKIVSPAFAGPYSSLGGILGSSMRSSYIENCSVSGDILIHSEEGSELSNLGGLAGSLVMSNVSGCRVGGVILSATEDVSHNIGGISGTFGGGKISDCRVANIIMPKNSENTNLQGAVAGLLFIPAGSSGGRMMIENTWFHRTVAGGRAVGLNEAQAEVDAKPYDDGHP